MKTTFVNQNSEGNIIESAERYMKSRIEDFDYYREVSIEPSADELRDYVNNPRNGLSFADIRALINKTEEMGSFYNYGLCFDYVELETFDDQNEDYFRFQLSWGGPSDEVRFYDDGTIIYVYLDWFSGVGIDVTGEEWAEWLREWFEGCESLNFGHEREKYDYYERLYANEEEE